MNHNSMTDQMPESDFDISLIVCTHNRSSAMEVCVRSLLNNAGVDPARFEVVVVANNCTDDTHARVEAMSKKYSNLRLLDEQAPGLSNARNYGIVMTQTSLLAFFDDDIVARPDYLAEILNAFEDKIVLAVALRVLQDIDSPAPQWMKRRYPGDVATRLDHGEKAWWLDDKSGPVGAAMAFRRSVFDRFGMFQTNLGRKGKNLLANEELQLMLKLKAIPKSCRYVPKACVVHFGNTSRISWRYMLNRAYWKGVSNKRSNLRDPRYKGVPGMCRAMARLCKTICLGLKRLFIEIVHAAFLVLMAIFCRVGYIGETLRLGFFEKRFARAVKKSLPGRILLRIGKTWTWCYHALLALLNVRTGRLSVQLQTTSVCDGKCRMCPYLQSWQKENPGKMSATLFHNIMEQLKGRKLKKFCLYLENEPLLDKDLIDRLQLARDTLDFRILEISTNVSSLTPARAEALADAVEGVKHEIWISFHGVDEESYRKIMGLDFHRVLGNVVNLLQIAQKRDLNIRIRGAGSAIKGGKQQSPHHFSCVEFENFWESVFRKHQILKKPKLIYLAYHDRAGSVKSDGYNFEVKRPSLLGMYCNRADQWLHVLYNGEIILCCNDYHRKTVIGDLNTQSIKELLASSTYRDYRLMMMGLKSAPDDFICRACVKPGG